MITFFIDRRESMHVGHPLRALLLLFVLFFFSTGFLPHYLDVIDKDKMELTQNGEEEGESSQEKKNGEQEIDDYVHYAFFSTLYHDLTVLAPRTSERDWYHAYPDIFTPPPEQS